MKDGIGYQLGDQEAGIVDQLLETHLPGPSGHGGAGDRRFVHLIGDTLV
ncbi:MAG: hypothetical protein M3083_11215 [Actinomycetota bacterium]|nr:hypothetical protein [Actinomycetota bacterium]